jgi:hypothetical protein
MIHLGFLSAEELMMELARQQGVRYVDVADLWVPREIVRLVPEKLIQKYGLLPIALGAETRRGPLICATSDPQNLIALDEVAFASGKTPTPVLANDDDLARCIERHLSGPGIANWGLPFLADARNAA